MKILCLKNNISIQIEDDCQKASKLYLDKANRIVIFDFKETNAKFSDFQHLAEANYQGYDFVFIFFDRIAVDFNSQPLSYAVTNLKGWATIPVGKAEDTAPNYLWSTIAHELMHLLIKRCLAKAIYIPDPMDLMFVNEKWQQYYKNLDPYASDGNFAEAFKRIKPYWDIIDPMPLKTLPITQDTTSLAKWQLVPDLAQKAVLFLQKASGQGFNIKITQGYRDPMYQDKLYAQGRTLPGAIVTNATGKTSKHCLGKAFDIAYVGTDPYPKNANWKAIGEIGKSCGLIWGGDFKSFPDLLHFEI